MDLTPLGLRVESQEVDTAEKRLDGLAESAKGAERAADGLAGGSKRAGGAIASMLANIEKAVREQNLLLKAQNDAAFAMSRQAAEAEKAAAKLAKVGAQAKVTATHFDTLYDAASRDFAQQYTAGMSKIVDTQGKAAGSSKALTQATLNLSRQFADIGVTAAMGMNPIMILIQQGPQIADALALAKTQGVGFTDVLKGMTAAAASFLAVIVPIGVVVGAAFGGAALAARALNQDNADLVDSLGLTEKQLKRLKDQGVDTGVTMGDVFKGTFNYIREAVGPALAPIGKWFSDLFDEITAKAIWAVKTIGGAFVGAYAAIKATWSGLPAALGDIAIQAGNAVVRAIESAINKALTAYNKALPLIRALMTATGNGAGAMGLREAGPVSLGQMENPWSGAAAKTMEDGAAAFKKANEGWADTVDSVGQGLRKSILDAARDRIKGAAGDAEKAKKDQAASQPARDLNDERLAQLNQQLAQAKQAELQAQLSLATDVAQRAAIENQILDMEALAQKAAIEKQRADIADQAARKSISAATAKELNAALDKIAAVEANTVQLRREAIEREKTATLAREQHDIQQGATDIAVDQLEAQADLLRSAYARDVVEEQILRLRQQQERLDLEETVRRGVLGGYSAQEVELARRRLLVLGEIHAAQMAQAKQQTRLIDAIGEAASAVSGFKSALKQHDWAGVFDNFVGGLQTILASFQANGLGGGLMTAGSAAASLIGGRTGQVAGNALGIAGLGLGFGAYMSSGAGLAMAGGLGGAIGGAAGAGIANGLVALGSVAGPIAVAAAALYAAAKIFNIGGKPTNAGAGYDLRDGSISGNKRTSETEEAARSAGEAIQGIQDALKAAGIGLTDAVTGLVIGTRDQTQIYLQSGQTLRSAVGDSGAAVDTAMRALLSSATFVSEAQKALVDSALAAGKGFDAIAEILAKYEAAQGIAKSLDAEILRLRDPQAFDTKAVRDDIEAQRKAYQQLASEGFLTAAQLAEITTQLSTLEGLRLDEVTKRYAEAQVEAAMTLEEKTRTLRGLDIEYQRILGNEAAAVAMERADVIAGLKGDADLIAAYTRNWAAKGPTETFEAAINITRKRLVTPTVRDPLSGVDVTSMWRGADLAFQAANDNVTSMAERAMDAARAFGELQTSLKGYRDELLYGDKSALSADARYADLEKLFRSTANSAALGDKGAAGQLQSVIDQFLDASRSQFGSGAGYASDFARAIAALDAATGKVNAPTATLRALQGYDVFDPEGPTVAGRQDSPGFRGPYWEPNGSAGPGEPQNYTQRFPSGRPTPASNTMSKEDAEELKALLRRQNQLLEAANNQRGQAAVLTKEGLEGVKGEVRRGNKDRVRLAG